MLFRSAEVTEMAGEIGEFVMTGRRTRHDSVNLETVNSVRASSTRRRIGHPRWWSFTSPIDCMNAYIVVGPTNDQPRRLRSRDIAVDSADVTNDATSDAVG